MVVKVVIENWQLPADLAKRNDGLTKQSGVQHFVMQAFNDRFDG
jgi:hypothetical protein